MRHFEANGLPYIQINGKTFFLLRGYCVRYDKWVFVQVHGTAPLSKDDLPEKSWELISTKDRTKKVYTAWSSGYFDGKNETQLFVGVTLDAALRSLLATKLAPEDIEHVLPLCTEIDTYTTKPRIRYETGISTLEDKGAAGVPALSINESYKFAHFIETCRKEAACPR